MMLRVVGCNFQKTPLALREKLAFNETQLAEALADLNARYGCEAVILNTCNRVEIYLARMSVGEPGALATGAQGALATGAPPTGDHIDSGLIAEFLAGYHQVDPLAVRLHLYEYTDAAAVKHLFRVAGSLDSLIVGEGQIAGQVKEAYETAQKHAAVGPVLHALYQHARLVAKRVRTETGIAQGHVSVSSAAVDYVRQVFSHFDDKTVLVIGAGKMGELTLKHLQELKPRRIWLTNRSFDKAEAMAKLCGGTAFPWDDLDNALSRVDIVLSTTGAPDVIVSKERWDQIRASREGGAIVILDIAVPRDFDPAIHDGDQTCLFNIDDLKRIREQTLADRQKHIAPAEAIVAEEQKRFLKLWQRRQHAPLIARLTQELEARRQERVKHLLARLDGRLTDKDRTLVEGEFRQQQNEFLHVVISALNESSHEAGHHGLLEAIRKFFRLE